MAINFWGIERSWVKGDGFGRRESRAAVGVAGPTGATRVWDLPHPGTTASATSGPGLSGAKIRRDGEDVRAPVLVPCLGHRPRPCLVTVEGH